MKKETERFITAVQDQALPTQWKKIGTHRKAERNINMQNVQWKRGNNISYTQWMRVQVGEKARKSGTTCPMKFVQEV